MTPHGITVTAGDNERSIAKKFITAASAAFATSTPEAAAPAGAGPPGPTAAEVAAAHEMMRTGYALIYSNCNQFFESAGETQKWLIFSKDQIAATGTLGSAVLALHNGTKNAIANVALASNTAVSWIDIYSRNFLFASENIESVRDLTLKALTTHASAVGYSPTDNYESATVALLDNQNICMPRSIASLARQAISSGKPQVSETDKSPTGLAVPGANGAMPTPSTPPGELRHVSIVVK